MGRTIRASDSKTEKGLGSKIDHGKQTPIEKHHLIAGDTSNKIPISLSDGRTVVFAKCKEDVEKVKEFWEDKIKHINYS